MATDQTVPSVRRPRAGRGPGEGVLGTAVLLARPVRIGNALDVEAASAGSTPSPAETSATKSAAPVPKQTQTVKVRHYLDDGSTFVDDDYLIRGVPGRLLHKLLHEVLTGQRTEFTNREIRLDPALELPAWKDNFEARLIVLRRRLDERDAPFRIAKTGRGQFRLDLLAPVELEVVAGRD